MTLNEQIARTLKQLNAASVTAVATGEIGKAIELFKQEMKLEGDLGLALQAAESGMNLANAYLLAGETAKAVENIETALAVFTTKRRTHDACNALFVLGEIRLQEGDTESALRAYGDCLKMKLDSMDESTCHLKIAQASLRMNASSFDMD